MPSFVPLDLNRLSWISIEYQDRARANEFYSILKRLNAGLRMSTSLSYHPLPQYPGPFWWAYDPPFLLRGQNVPPKLLSRPVLVRAGLPVLARRSAEKGR